MKKLIILGTGAGFHKVNDLIKKFDDNYIDYEVWGLATNLFHKNRRFFDIKNILYYLYLGFFGIILNIVFFFLTLKTTSITFTMVGFLLSVIFIAFYEKGVNFERFDVFKVLYIIILFFSIISI